MRMSRPVIAVCAVALAVTLVTGPTSAADAAGDGSAATTTADTTTTDTSTTDTTDATTSDAGTTTATGVATAKKKPFHVTGGSIINNPLGSNAARYSILNKIDAAVKHARRGSTIKIMSWNFMSDQGVKSLLAAQRRHVKIRLIMSASNMSEDVPNPYFRRLRAGLNKGNKEMHLKPSRKSHAKMCKLSCRGKSGAAHAKFYLFSQTGTSHDVLMEGSANYTAAAANNQWNDIHTFVGQPKWYDFAEKIFDQMWLDKPAKVQFRRLAGDSITMAFGPETSGFSPTKDPWISLLSKVRCTHAVDGNANHHTVIRLAPDVIRGKRGMQVAQMLKALWNNYCDIHIGYTILGHDIYKYLTADTGRGPVPIEHLVQDSDHDGQFDNYFHLKVMTINGVVGDNKNAHVMINGSSNLSGYSKVSDENMAIFWRKNMVKKYQRVIDHWFDNPPPDNDTSQKPDPARRTVQQASWPGPTFRQQAIADTGVDPYAQMDLD